MKKVFYQVDAFTDTPFGGNPAGVVLDAGGLDERQMLNIAREVSLSETAFVRKVEEKEYDYEVRFFTPTEEVDLCGHATIATFFILAQNGLIKEKSKKVIVRQKTLAGILPVEIHFNENKVQKVMMTQKKPEHIFTLNKINEIASIMGIDSCDIGLDGFQVLPMAYSTGLPDIMLPVKNIEILRNIDPNHEELIRYSVKHNIVGVHAFTLKDYNKGIISCRNFAPAFGIKEEAATGTSNGALAAYLIRNGIIKINEKVNLICEQGYFMERPSQIYVEAIQDNKDLTIKVGGKAVLTIDGKIYL